MREERKVTSNITIEDARLIFRNFSGKETEFNEKGKRKFGVLLPDELAESIREDGWNVKYLKPRPDDPDQYRQPWLEVKVKFDPYPPIIQLINSLGRVRLTEEDVDQLDWAIIETCDVVIRPYNYPAMRGRAAGVSAYLKALYVTIVEDRLEEKYANVPVVEPYDRRGGFFKIIKDAMNNE